MRIKAWIQYENQNAFYRGISNRGKRRFFPVGEILEIELPEANLEDLTTVLYINSPESREVIWYEKNSEELWRKARADEIIETRNGDALEALIDSYKLSGRFFFIDSEDNSKERDTSRQAAVSAVIEDAKQYLVVNKELLKKVPMPCLRIVENKGGVPSKKLVVEFRNSKPDNLFYFDAFHEKKALEKLRQNSDPDIQNLESEDFKKPILEVVAPELLRKVLEKKD